MPIVTLTTDFGTQDSYVAQMKGRMLAVCPELTFVDVTHEIAPGDMAATAYILADLLQSFAESAIHLFVVDPGVGSARKSAAIEMTDGRRNVQLVGPDNGIPDYVTRLKGMRLVQAVNLTAGPFMNETISHTFHGRDLFAPSAALWAREKSLSQLGEHYQILTEDALLNDLLMIQQNGRHLTGRIIHIDRFGNLITSIRQRDIRKVFIEDQMVTLGQTFSDVLIGHLVAYFGSSGYLEIAVNQGSAAQVLNKKVGDGVKCEFSNSIA